MSPYNPLSQNRGLLFVFGALGLVIIGYSLFVAGPYLLGPTLTVESLSEVQDQPTVTVKGATARVSYLSVNGQPVPLAEDGTFTVERAFPTGYTVLVVEARDRFGRTKTTTVNLVLTHNTSLNGVQTKEVSIERN